MGFLGRIVDKLDDAVTDARGRAAAQREARKFAAGVRPGDTIYTINTHHTFNKDQDLVQEHVVGRGGRVGSDSVAGMFLRNKAVTTSRPAGLKTVKEFDEEQVAAPEFPNPTKDQAKTRVKAGAHR